MDAAIALLADTFALEAAGGVWLTDGSRTLGWDRPIWA